MYTGEPMYSEEQIPSTERIAGTEKNIFVLIKKTHETLERIDQATSYIQVGRGLVSEKSPEPPKDSKLDEGLKTLLAHAQEILAKLN